MSIWQETEFKSLTYGDLSLEGMAGVVHWILDREGKGFSYEMAIGSDSQLRDGFFCLVTVLVLHKFLDGVGQGALFFYSLFEYEKGPVSLREKIFQEAGASVTFADCFCGEYERQFGVDLCLRIELQVDAGKNGDTREVIPEVARYVVENGYKVVFKPEAEEIRVADVLSK